MCLVKGTSLLFLRARGGKTMRSSKKESGFQDRLKKTIEEELLPGSMVFKIDPKQGIPDLLVLYGKHWALLECKKAENAKHQPNQDYYVEKLDQMSFSRFVYPENREEVLSELQRAFKPSRATRSHEPK